MALRTLIVDDETPARRRLSKLLRPFVDQGRLAPPAEAADGVEALGALEDQPVDLLFLDIQMPELDGFDVLERIPPERRPAIVFTTAYDAYAVRAFEVNAVDYVLKPITRERLQEAVLRVERSRETPEAREATDARLQRLLAWIDAQASPPEERPRDPEPLRQISIPYRDRILIVPVTRLVSAEIDEGITRLFIVDDQAHGPKPRLRPHIVNYTLDQLEASLDPNVFMRVHRSTLIQLDCVEEMIPWFSGRYKLVLTGSHEVIASRERSRHLRERLML
jgi:two-component system, LytTR family, response regulator